MASVTFEQSASPLSKNQWFSLLAMDSCHNRMRCRIHCTWPVFVTASRAIFWTGSINWRQNSGGYSTVAVLILKA